MAHQVNPHYPSIFILTPFPEKSISHLTKSHHSWTWNGAPGQVKSYANAQLSLTPKPLSQITSIPTTWTYQFTPGTSPITADISYDIFLDANPANTGGGAHHDYEIMIWLADLGGANPISSSYGANGPNFVATGIPLAGQSWKLAKGPSSAAGGGQVFSFLAEQEVSAFKGDVMEFLKYLRKNQGLDFGQNLVYLAAGTEPFV